MTQGVWILLVGMMFLMGMFMLVFALYRLSTPEGPSNVTPMPIRSEKDEEEDGPKLTKLGRPVQDIRLRA